MSSELSALTCAALIQCGQYCLMAVPVNLELGTRLTLSARDKGVMGGSIEDKLSARTARLVRALDNHFEALILFTIAVTVVTLTQSSTGLTQFCAWLYVVARIVYIPAYAFAWVPWRSVFWFAGFIAIFIMLMASLG